MFIFMYIASVVILLYSLIFKGIISDIPSSIMEEELNHFNIVCIASIILVLLTIFIAKSFKEKIAVSILVFLMLGHFAINFIDLYNHTTNSVCKMDKLGIIGFGICSIVLTLRFSNNINMLEEES